MGNWRVIVMMFGMAACGGPAQQTRPATASESQSSTAENRSGCATVVKLAELCYATSGPETSCSDVYTAVGAAVENADLRPSERQALATFCGRTCMMRKNGVSWYSVERSMNENCN